MTDFTLDSADRLRRSVGDLVRALQQRENTPGGQLETLGFLLRDGSQSIADLARRRRIRHQSMSGTVADLEAAGLVTRVPHPTDGRGVLIELTAAGAAVVGESRVRRSTTILAAAEQVLTAEERETLARVAGLFDRLRDAVTDDKGTYDL